MIDGRTSTIHVAVVGGDGIGPEVTAVAVEALRLAAEVDGATIETQDFDLGAGRWHRTGETITDDEIDELRTADAILLGAVGDPGVPSGVLERGLLLRLRFALDQYVNLRPCELLPGVASPLAADVLAAGPIDFVVVREGTEGPYVGNGGALRVGTPHEIATEVSVNTAFGVERVVRNAFARANERPRRHLTLVHKHNVLVHAGHLWRRTAEAVNREYPDVTLDYLHVDAATIVMVSKPQILDVVVTDNLFGDIITDLAAAVTGGIGLAASGNVNPERATPSMFEPVHGSAPDIAGRGLADPTAAVLSAAMLADHVGLRGAADALRSAVRGAVADRAEQGGATTAGIAGSIMAQLRLDS